MAKYNLALSRLNIPEKVDISHNYHYDINDASKVDGSHILLLVQLSKNGIPVKLHNGGYHGRDLSGGKY